MDTLSRREWYAESDYDPSPFRRNLTSDLVLSWYRGSGKQAFVQMILDAKPFAQALANVGTHLHGAIMDLAPRPPAIPSNESVRERALRLAKQPHSMAQDPRDFHFDHRGRRRY